MHSLSNDKGSVLVFMTLMIVLLMIMVGMGLDTGQLTYSRATGQAAVDAAALSAVSALPSRIAADVETRAAAFASNNNYVDSPNNLIKAANVSYVQYDFTTNQITNYSAPIATANGVRVALEQATNSAIATPAFLTPLFKLFGGSAPGANNVNVSAVSVIQSKPSIPIALWSTQCAQNGVEYDVKIQMQHPSSDGENPAGENACWTTFFDCSSGAPDIKAGFTTAGSCSGATLAGNLALGSMICQNRGQVNSVLQAAEKFFTENPNRWWIIPVLGGGGNCAPDNPTGITNFAKIYPTAFETKGNPKYIQAKVVCGPELINDAELSLCFSHRLVREAGKGY
jgi:Putative Flp pilus-assembly TadE/G-like